MHPRRFLIPVICICLATILTVRADETTHRQPVPDAAAQAKVQTQLDQVFGTDLAQKPLVQQTEAAGKMLAAAGQKQDDSATIYVLLKDARDLACSSGAAEIAIPATDRLARLYQIDGAALELETLTKVLSTASSAKSCQALVNGAAMLADHFAEADDWHLLGRLATIADTAATESDSGDLLRKTRDHFDALHALHVESDRLRAARQSLEKDAADPQANLTLGAHLCIVKGEWDQGIKMLAKGADHSLATIAAKDGAAPSAPAARADLADAWWKLASMKTGSLKLLCEVRAAHWYKLAAPDAAAVARLQMQQHIESARAAAVQFYATDPTFRARDMVHSESGRAAIDAAQTMPFPQAAIAADTTLEKGELPYEITQTLQVTGTLKLVPGIEIIGGTIDMGTKGHIVAAGEANKPVIFRHVTFAQDLGSSLTANHAVFDQCIFKKGGVWYSSASSKWTFDHCILYQCQFARLTGVDYGIQISNCALVSMDFPEIDHGDKTIAELRSEWTKIEACEFVDCSIPPTVFWCSDSCNFAACSFIGGKIRFIGDRDWTVHAHVVDTINKPPNETWDDAAKKHVQIVDGVDVFPTLDVPADCSVPEITSGDSIRVVPSRFKATGD